MSWGKTNMYERFVYSGLRVHIYFLYIHIYICMYVYAQQRNGLRKLDYKTPHQILDLNVFTSAVTQTVCPYRVFPCGKVPDTWNPIDHEGWCDDDHSHWVAIRWHRHQESRKDNEQCPSWAGAQLELRVSTERFPSRVGDGLSSVRPCRDQKNLFALTLISSCFSKSHTIFIHFS